MIFLSADTLWKFLTRPAVAIGLWFGLSLIALAQDLWFGHLNNFEVFRHVFFHLREHRNLYLPYPAEYDDVNLYGPLFGLLIAPFALLPLPLGATTWVVANLLFLFFAVRRLPLPSSWRYGLISLCAHEMMNNSSWLQANGFVAGCILLSFVYAVRQKEYWSVFFALLATFVKLYGIVALGFLALCPRKAWHLCWVACWSIVFLITPALLCGGKFLVQTYQDWAAGLQVKADKNVRLDINNFFQDISLFGLLRRTIAPRVNDLWILAAGCTVVGWQWLRNRFIDIREQLYLLCYLSVFVVIFSTGSESPTYIIALPGLCLWFLFQPVHRWTTAGFILIFILTTFSYSDLFTPWLREHVIRRYSIKAIPSVVVWCITTVQLQRKQFVRARFPLLPNIAQEKQEAGKSTLN